MRRLRSRHHYWTSPWRLISSKIISPLRASLVRRYKIIFKNCLYTLDYIYHRKHCRASSSFACHATSCFVRMRARHGRVRSCERPTQKVWLTATSSWRVENYIWMYCNILHLALIVFPRSAFNPSSSASQHSLTLLILVSLLLLDPCKCHHTVPKRLPWHPFVHRPFLKLSQHNTVQSDPRGTSPSQLSGQTWRLWSLWVWNYAVAPILVLTQ